MTIEHFINLSTTEPNNDVGIIKIRQSDEQTQTLVANITENGVPKDFTGYQPFFCAKLGQTAGLGIIEQKVEGAMNPANGTLEYTINPEDWQILGRQTAYFSFRKMKDEHEWTEQFTTRDFNYNVIPNIFSKGIQEVKKDGGTYIWTIEDMLRLFKEYIATGKVEWENYKNDERTIWETYRLAEKINWDDYKLREKNEWKNYKDDGKTTWEKFVEDNREFLENADPGGKIILELLGGRGGFDSLGERLDNEKAEVSAQLAQTEKKVESKFVNLASYGAVADYLLEDGTINSNPTDNSEAVRAAFSDSNRVRAGDDKGRGYYFSEPINLPLSAELDLNENTFFFEDDGINIGSYIWTQPKIYKGRITGIGRKGIGLFYENGYVVYPEFDLHITNFKKATHFQAPTENSNLTWGNVNLKIENCDIGLHLEGGWANSVEFGRLHFHTLKKQAVLIENCPQMHAFIINRLEMEECAKDEDGRFSPFHVKGSFNGEITIYNSYIEGNGYQERATPEDVTIFKTNGVKIPSLISGLDSKSWELNGKVYSEDTNHITQKDLRGSATFRFDNCRSDLRVNFKNMYITSTLLGIASFNQSPMTLTIDNLHLTTLGYSFPNTREVFTNLTPESKVTIISNRLTNEGGGHNFIYGDVEIEGSLFGNVITTKKFKNENYAFFTWASNVILPPLVKTDLSFDRRLKGTLQLKTKPENNKILIVPESGLYLISFSFVFNSSNVNGVVIECETSFTNRIGQIIPKLIDAQLNSLTGMIFFEKGDELKISIRNLHDQSVNIVGANDNVNYLKIQKVN